MTKNIILLSDGTGNADSSPHRTNVWRMYKAIDLTAKVDQRVFYDNGVGTSSMTAKRLLGQAFGFGVKRNVKELYANLCRVYKEGDQIYIFGYSRGAFTARVLAALIGNQGIIKSYASEHDLLQQVEAAYDGFRHDNFVPSVLSSPWWLYRWFTNSKNPESRDATKRHFYHDDGKPLIKWLGVWDSVDAYGAPIDELTRGWDSVIWPLTAKDRDLTRAVEYASHALAVDEQREAFEPMLWNEDIGENGATFKQDSRIEQVWFAGVHANVGGGYPDDSLAHVSLNWMIKKANGLGLILQPAVVAMYEQVADANGPIYDNRAGIGNIYRFAPRNIEALCNFSRPGFVNWIRRFFRLGKPETNRVRIDSPKIHHSVFDRIRENGDGYAPINLPEHYCVIDKEGRVVPQPKESSSDRSFETISQARNRRISQSEAWNKVWLLKLLYFVMLFVLMAFVAAPYVLDGTNTTLQGINGFFDAIFGTMGDIFRIVPRYLGKLTGFKSVENWANLYGNYPYIFLLGLVAITALLYFVGLIKSALQNEMRTDWSHITCNGNRWADDQQPKERSGFANFLDTYRVLPDPKKGGGIATDNLLRVSLADSASHIVRVILEALSVLLFFLLVLIVFWKVYFWSADGAGSVCKDASTSKDKSTQSIGSTNMSFDPTNPCFDTGFTLTKGIPYKLKFTVGNNWADATIDADAEGLVKPATWGMTLAVPLRRHWSKDWFQLIARVGDKGFDRHAAPYVQPKKTKDDKTRSMSFQFTPRQSGKLFVYLNDAIFLSFNERWPFVSWQFYDNNCEKKCTHGKITVSPAESDTGETVDE